MTQTPIEIDKSTFKFSGFVTVVNIIHLSEKIFVLNFKCPEITSQAKPGQFIQLKPLNTGSTIWPRPFSIHRVNDGIVTITVKRYGKITNRIARLLPGDKVFVTGPLGNSFTLPTTERPLYLIAGGVGLPPLHFLCETLLRNGYSPKLIHFYSGARTADELFTDEDNKTSGIDYVVTTDDGSSGIKGFITEPFAEELNKFRIAGNDTDPLIYSCGPMVMLKKAAEICNGFKCYVSLEQLMPCGWGVCNGCAVKIKKRDDTKTEDNRDFRLARVCREGPVFEASEIIWE